jgi:dTDP-glucose 4,6-dehydratase
VHKNIVITGYLGFIGVNVTKFLLASEKYKDFTFRLIDLQTYASNKEFYGTFRNKRCTEEIADIKDLTYIDADIIINMAAESHVANSIENCTEFIDTNISGVRNILDLIKSNKTKLLHFSTDEVYGDKQHDDGSVEDDAVNPSNPYAVTKASADMLIKAYARTYGINYTILRLTNNYGKYQHSEKFIPSLLESLKKNTGLYKDRLDRFKLHDQGEPRRNWLHVDDTCAAVEVLMDHMLSVDKITEIYNCNGICELRNIDAFCKIVSAYQYGNFSKEKLILEKIYSLVDFSYNRPGQDVRYFLNDQKLRALGWTPSRNFEEEIKKLIKFKRSM